MSSIISSVSIEGFDLVLGEVNEPDVFAGLVDSGYFVDGVQYKLTVNSTDCLVTAETSPI